MSERYSAGKLNRTLLAVDETQFTAPVRRENTRGGAEQFPPVYGPVTLTAAAAHAPLVRDGDGRIQWPAGW